MVATRSDSLKNNSKIEQGLVEVKRVRKPKAAGTDGGPSTPAVPKGKGKGKGKFKGLDLESPHGALAAAILERGANFKFPDRVQQDRGRRVKWPASAVPITDPTKLPKGWSVDEPDLEENDLEKQMARCYERIAENIMPDIFKSRLDAFQAIRNEQIEIINSERLGTKWEIAQRLDCLKKLEKNLQAEDKDDNLVNVKAIIAAYRANQLDWDGKSVTFWSKGGLITGPKPLNMKELYTLSAQYGPKGFWVEGMDGCAPQHLYLFLSFNPCHEILAMHTIHITLRNPATQETSTMSTSITFDFLEDTGASTMRVFEDDIAQIERLSGKPVPVLGQGLKQTAGGQVMVRNVILQANMLHGDTCVIPYWVDIQTSVSPGRRGTQGDRLSGVWIYHLLFVLSMPDSTRNKHFGTDIKEMVENLPIPNYKEAVPPPWV